MRVLAAASPDRAINPQVVERLPWEHNGELLDKLETREMRGWYAGSAIEFGWSRAVPMNQIMWPLHLRAATAPSNLRDLLPYGDSELVQQITKIRIT